MRVIKMGTYLVQATISWKSVQTMVKKLFKLKKITHVDDMMMHNFVKYLVQTRFHLWDIKRTNFKPGSCPNDLLEIYYFYLTNEVEFGQDILQDCVSSYHLHVWFFLMNLDNFFIVVCMDFHKVVVCTRYVPN